MQKINLLPRWHSGWKRTKLTILAMVALVGLVVVGVLFLGMQTKAKADALEQEKADKEAQANAVKQIKAEADQIRAGIEPVLNLAKFCRQFETINGRYADVLEAVSRYIWDEITLTSFSITPAGGGGGGGGMGPGMGGMGAMGPGMGGMSMGMGMMGGGGSGGSSGADDTVRFSCVIPNFETAVQFCKNLERLQVPPPDPAGLPSQGSGTEPLWSEDSVTTGLPRTPLFTSNWTISMSGAAAGGGAQPGGMMGPMGMGPGMGPGGMGSGMPPGAMGMGPGMGSGGMGMGMGPGMGGGGGGGGGSAATPLAALLSLVGSGSGWPSWRTVAPGIVQEAPMTFTFTATLANPIALEPVKAAAPAAAAPAGGMGMMGAPMGAGGGAPPAGGGGEGDDESTSGTRGLGKGDGGGGGDE